ncbi:putative inorganic phosphate transporter 1-3 [Bienertia sinuspersici]
MMGFFFMTVFMFAIAFPIQPLATKGNRIGFILMYGLTFFFANFGPNATTFVVPAEVFPARLRSTCHGISAATGKAGAIGWSLRICLRFTREGSSKERSWISSWYWQEELSYCSWCH